MIMRVVLALDAGPMLMKTVVADGAWEREEIAKYLEAHPW